MFKIKLLLLFIMLFIYNGLSQKSQLSTTPEKVTLRVAVEAILTLLVYVRGPTSR